MAAPNPTVPAISLPATLGALLMGVLFSAFVYGISTLHGIFYLHKFHHHDPWAIKLYVGFIWSVSDLVAEAAADTDCVAPQAHGHRPPSFCDLGTVSLCGLLFWEPAGVVEAALGIQGRSAPVSRMIGAALTTCSQMLTILSVLIINSVQGFYLHRVWRLSGLKSRIMVFVAGLSVLCGFERRLVRSIWVDAGRQNASCLSAFPRAIPVLIYVLGWLACSAQSQSFLELQRRDLMIAAEASFSIATASDFAIAGAMCYYLWSSKKTVPHLRGSRLHVAINSVILGVAYESDLARVSHHRPSRHSPPSHAAADRIDPQFITLPHTLIFFAVSFLLTKCYVVSLFTLLNLRRGNNLTPDQTKAGESSNSYSMGFRRNVSHHLDSAVDRAPVMGVHVDVERSATADPVLDLTGSVKISAFQISDELDHKASQW
ncbi:unnamed protein product [Mycena citricolor]|uniref:DUF6534 domain-containing protein n=1 Tax=Mycena citricolor TaxID=2018698 RepID=A0AAD2K937_9AGAR|nr:unnamed protein product [Mycena citricolor]